MDLGSIGNLLKSYIGGSAPTDETAHEHFDNVAQGVNSSTLAQGIAAAFRSDQTPPFAQMVSQLFTNGSVDQKTGMLNALLGSASPAMLSQLAGLLPGGAASITPSQVSEISPEAVQQIAEKAEKHDPSIVDRMSSVYAEHPTLVKTLGTAAMVIALRKIAERNA